MGLVVNATEEWSTPRGSRGSKRSKTSQTALRFCSRRLRGGPHAKGRPLPAAFTVTWGTSVSAGERPGVLERLPWVTHTHTGCFTWGAALGIYRGDRRPSFLGYLDPTGAFSLLTGAPIPYARPALPAGVTSRGLLLRDPVRPPVSRGAQRHPNVFLRALAPAPAPTLVTRKIRVGEAPQEADASDLKTETTPSRCGPGFQRLLGFVCPQR